MAGVIHETAEVLNPGDASFAQRRPETLDLG
jgi:hypothetical protein